MNDKNKSTAQAQETDSRDTSSFSLAFMQVDPQEAEKYQDLVPVLRNYDELVAAYHDSLELLSSLSSKILGPDVVKGFNDLYFKKNDKKDDKGDFLSMDASDTFADEVEEVLGARNDKIHIAIPGLKSVVRNLPLQYGTDDDRQFGEDHYRKIGDIQQLPFWAIKERFHQLSGLEAEVEKQKSQAGERKATRARVAMFLRQRREKMESKLATAKRIHGLLKNAHKLQEVLGSSENMTARQRAFARGALPSLKSLLIKFDDSGLQHNFQTAYANVERGLNEADMLRRVHEQIEQIEITMEQTMISRRTKLRGVLILVDAMGGSRKGVAEIAEQYRSMEQKIITEYERVKDRLILLKSSVSPAEGQDSDRLSENLEGVAEYVSGGTASAAILREFNSLIQKLDRLTEKLEDLMNDRKKLPSSKTALLEHEGDEDSVGHTAIEFCREIDLMNLSVNEKHKLALLLFTYQESVVVAKEIAPTVETKRPAEVFAAIMALGPAMLKEIAQFEKPMLVVSPKSSMTRYVNSINKTKGYQQQADTFVWTDSIQHSPFRSVQNKTKNTISIVDGAAHMPHIPGIPPDLRFDQRKAKFKEHYKKKGMKLINSYEYAALMQHSLREYERAGSNDTSKIMDFCVDGRDTASCLDDEHLSISPHVAFGYFDSRGRQVFFSALNADNTLADLRGRPSVQVMEY